ncbi:1-phosphofructokinase family hexose kinase [Leekyejoonella antrihumi]|uniref:1-phosphofructokinase family hexose kinase n=1 Tax=Leekyejoonella antrihumi TaxID=1660198 RepID=A0A563DT07_9MICO|nr:1-phosphofructokinase family hexose kinase [Leekyejoonella antrihumi]TWP33123.1 1-phosphofructokinase family hexose kinase [Leekyejoonella antrihumi]
MIVTLTCSPTLDRTLAVAGVRRGQENWSADSALEPGGDGITVTRALLAHGAQSTAVLPIGGVTGRQMTLLLSDAGVPFAPVPITGSLRVDTAVVEPGGTTTTFHERGPSLCAQEAFALLACTDDQLQGASRDESVPGAGWLAVCGPLATGLPEDFYATVVRRAHTYGAQVAVAVPGQGLRHALDAGPDLVAVNRAELAQVAGGDLPTLVEVRRAAQDLVRRGVPVVIITLGADGAMLVSDHECLHARASGVRPVCTAGAGPALLAGVLHALDQGAPADRALMTGVAWGAAAVQQPGLHPPGPAQTAASTVNLSRSNDALPDSVLRPAQPPPGQARGRPRPRHRAERAWSNPATARSA